MHVSYGQHQTRLRNPTDEIHEEPDGGVGMSPPAGEFKQEKTGNTSSKIARKASNPEARKASFSLSVEQGGRSSWSGLGDLSGSPRGVASSLTPAADRERHLVAVEG